MENRNNLRDQLEKLKELNISEISTDEKLFSFREIETEVALIFKSAQTALNYPGFINELPEQDAQQIANAVDGLYGVLVDIADHRYDSVWLSASYDSSIENVNNRYRELYKLLIVPVREYASSIESNEIRLQELLSEIKKIREESEKIREESAATVKHAQDATSDISTVELSKHFESLLGSPISYSWSARKKDYKKWKKTRENKKSRLIKTKNLIIRIGIWFYLLFRYCWRKIKKAIFGFDAGYERSSRLWLNSTLIFLLITIVLAVYVKRDLDTLISASTATNSILAIALVKLLLILAPLYAIKFSVRNYSANRHLVVVNQHKAVVMKTLLAFLDRKEISSNLKGEIMTTAVKEAFTTPETGFIKDKDGTNSIEQNVFDKITRDRSVN